MKKNVLDLERSEEETPPTGCFALTSAASR